MFLNFAAVPYRAWRDTTSWLRNSFAPRILLVIIPLLSSMFFGAIGALVYLIH